MLIASRAVLVLAIMLIAEDVGAEVGSEIRDTAVRIDYGFYTEDQSLIAAARDALSDRSDNPWTSYLRAYSSYRAAMLKMALNRSAGTLLDDCISEAETATESKESKVEAIVLIAACTALSAADEPSRAVMHQRRFRRALTRAASLEPDNPRLLLVAFTASPAADLTSRPGPHALLDAFRARAEPFAFPDWGEAEALTVLGAHQLEGGDRRGARDLLEAALLIAPDYRAALQLEANLVTLAATN